MSRGVVVGILVLLLASTGCASLGDHYTVTIDPAFTADEQASAVAAVDAWTAAVPVTLDVVVGTCAGRHPNEICIHSSDAATVAHKVPDGVVHLGYTACPDASVDGAEIFISTAYVEQTAAANTAPWLAQENFAHELGHAMGLEHENGVGALMNATAIGSSRGAVTAADTAQWSKVRGH